MDSTKNSSQTPLWLVTGAARGLGRAIVEAALRSGASVLAASRGAPDILQGELSKQTNSADRVKAIQLDVAGSEEHIFSTIASGLAHFGRTNIDVLVNNAGYSDILPIEQTSLDSFRQQLEVNLFGPIACTKAVLPGMRQAGTGHIIQISSVAGQVGPAGRGPYATAKWGLEGFSEVLAVEVAPLGLHVTIIEPGGFRTDFAAATTAQQAVLEPYQATVGRMLGFQASYSGKQPGDPLRAAEAIVHVATMAQPPLRLALGSDAYEAIAAKTVQREQEREAFKAISTSMSYEAGERDLSEAWKSLPI
ncbi:short-chain alcohol dehydrogenase [Flagelloscypha sp. PMI_526]|nr:short-chain alcohol dehydrogenase [Flagelloscypha sp. PMI_526]